MQRMDRLRRSLRESFRRKRDGPESSKPHQWHADEEAVRAGNCTFHVKYLGCVEVFESRGMQVCEEAMKVLRASRRRPVKANLYVTGDGLRVVEDETKGLIVDQTIEKVSFCAPDRNHERGFSYICRDGTTRRWMCHGFLASKDSGERLSHAVGCAFAVCLERKQKREKECGVTMTYDSKTSTFTRSGSFRVTSMTDSLSSKSTSSVESGTIINSAPSRPPVVSTHAIERPHATVNMLERQGSFRGFSQLSNHSPFKRQLSLRLNELPSNLQRTQQNALNIFGNNASNNVSTNNSIPPISASPAPPPRTQRNRLHSLPTGSLTVGTIPEASSSNTSSELSLASTTSTKVENKDLVSELCQQVSQGLSLLAANHDESKANGYNGTSTSNKFPTKFTNPWDEEVGGAPTNSALPVFNTTPLATANAIIKPPKFSSSSNNSTNNLPSVATIPSKPTDSWMNNLTQNHEPKAPLQSKISPIKENIPIRSSPTKPSIITTNNRNIFEPAQPPVTNVNSNIPTTTNNSNVVNNITTSNTPTTINSISSSGIKQSQQQVGPANNLIGRTTNFQRGPPRSQSLGSDPFDADWAAPLARTGQTPTNPFARQQTFQISM